MSTATNNDREVTSGYANQLTEYLFGKNLNFTPDGWDISGGTVAITEELGSSLNKLFGSWSNVNDYKSLQYERAARLITDAEVQAGKLSSGAAAEAASIRRTAQVAAESMREMGDLAAKGIPLEGASSPANMARAAQYMAAFAKAAGGALALGQIGLKAYDAITGEATVHDVMSTAFGGVLGIAAGSVVSALIGTALFPAVITAAISIGVGFVVGKIGEALYDRWGQGLTKFLTDTGSWWANAISGWIKPEELAQDWSTAKHTISPSFSTWMAMVLLKHKAKPLAFTSTTQATVLQNPLAGPQATTACWCATSMAMARSTTGANCLATTPA